MTEETGRLDYSREPPGYSVGAGGDFQHEGYVWWGEIVIDGPRAHRADAGWSMTPVPRLDYSKPPPGYQISLGDSFGPLAVIDRLIETGYLARADLGIDAAPCHARIYRWIARSRS